MPARKPPRSARKWWSQDLNQGSVIPEPHAKRPMWVSRYRRPFFEPVCTQHVYGSSRSISFKT